MYCRNCGKTIPDDAMLCCYCGQDQYPPAPGQAEPDAPAEAHETQPEPPLCGQHFRPDEEEYVSTEKKEYVRPGKEESVRSAPVLQKYRYNTSAKGRLVFGIVLFAVICFIAAIAAIITIYFETGALAIVGWSAVLIVVEVFGIACIIGNIKMIRMINQTELYVTAVGLYGSGGDEKYRIAMPFELPFSRIKKVSSLPKHLVISTDESAYYVLIHNPTAAEFFIDEVMKNYRENHPEE